MYKQKLNKKNLEKFNNYVKAIQNMNVTKNNKYAGHTKL